MARAREALLNDGAEPALLSRLIEFIEQADPLALSHMRPYALADLWGADRRATLQLFLMATRRGLLNLQWDLLCPMCRGARASLPSLGGITREVHCPACNINYKANFERSVELTFRPNPAIRPVEEKVYCIGSPQDTPHVVSQQLLGAGDRRAVMPALEPGRYRLRAMELHGWQALAVAENGAMEMTIAASEHGWPNEEPQVCPTPTLLLENLTPDEQLIILERIAWTDQAATAAEVTLLQMFRDLFANEALRPGEQISVGSLAILFTDLRGSTRLYREIGDAPAFGLVMDHFDLLREAVNAEGGVIVKTLGDSIMAAFRAPLAALRAALRAQRLLAESNPPLHIKVGLHFGPCIAVTLNDRLDYFGSSVNIAARLENLSAGDDVVISADVAQDPEVQVWLNTPDAGLETKPIQAALKGFDQERFDLYSVRYETEKEAV
jgi:class 3 adenylate cyclase